MKTLKATDGKYYSSADHKVMGTIIYLPDSVDDSKFTEISETTYKKYMKANEEAMKAEIEKLNNQQESQEVEQNETENETEQQ